MYLNRHLARNLTIAVAISVGSIGAAQAETRVTFKSAKTTSSYYQMSVQIAEAVKKVLLRFVEDLVDAHLIDQAPAPLLRCSNLDLDLAEAMDI